MGIPLGPVSLNISVGFHENRLFGRYSKPHVYLRYVDDTFSVFNSVEDTKAFHFQLSSLHSWFQSTVAMESTGYLNVLVERKRMCVYWKITVTGLCTNWNSLVPMFHRINLISALLRQMRWWYALLADFNKKMENIYSIFSDSVYHENIIKRSVERNIKRFKAPVVFTVILFYSESRIFANGLVGLEKSDTNKQSFSLCQIKFYVFSSRSLRFFPSLIKVCLVSK